MTLFNYNDQYRQAKIALEEMELDQDTIRDTLEGLDGEFKTKIEALGCIHREEELEKEALLKEIERLNEMVAQKDKSMQRLEEYMLAGARGYLLDHPEEKKIQTKLFTFRVSHSQQTIIDDEEKLQELAMLCDYRDMFKVTTKVTVSPDKKVIKEYLEKNADLQGYAHIQDNYTLKQK